MLQLQLQSTLQRSQLRFQVAVSPKRLLWPQLLLRLWLLPLQHLDNNCGVTTAPIGPQSVMLG